MRIPRAIFDDLIAHAREDAPNECCGMIGTKDGRAVQAFRTRNAAASPLRYEMDPNEQLKVYNAIEDAGLDLGAIYHSHTRSEPYPSQTDINLAAWPDSLYLIIGVAGDEPDLRGYRIVDGRIDEAELTVE
jgi:proteasome lid subunit RPN8/RPN11